MLVMKHLVQFCSIYIVEYFLYAIDFDECTMVGICEHNCTNIVGGYHCSCQVGFALVGGQNCTGKLMCILHVCSYCCGLKYVYICTCLFN